jgi:ATP-dependent DNA ligase
MTYPSKLPAGFVVPAQPVQRDAPPSGADWVHEIKHDGYRMIVRRDGDSVRLYSRNAIDWTDRLPAIAKGAALLKARSFTIDGEAVVVGPNGLTDFEALRQRGKRRCRGALRLRSGRVRTIVWLTPWYERAVQRYQ